MVNLYQRRKKGIEVKRERERESEKERDKQTDVLYYAMRKWLFCIIRIYINESNFLFFLIEFYRYTRKKFLFILFQFRTIIFYTF